MPTADRTTIKATFDAWLSDLRTNLVAEPPTVTKPFRKIVVGKDDQVDAHPRPWLSVAVTRIEPIGGVDDDKLWEVSSTLTVVSDVSAADAHPAIFDAIGSVEDRLDALRDSGVIEGAEGFDDRVWKFEYPKVTAGARVVKAMATQTIVIKVQRQQNRVPVV